MMKYFCILCLLILCSCRSSQKEIEAIVQEWHNKEVLFPCELVAKANARDTAFNNLYDNNYKILHYVDTSGCYTCNLKLYEWRKLLEEADSLNLDMSFIYVVFAQQDAEIAHAQLVNSFTHPIYFDATGQMDRLNKFPLKPEFRTFLLSPDNRVILIGDPIKNPSIWELYKQIIENQYDMIDHVMNT